MILSKKIYISTLLGGFLEYFDYTLYGFSAPYIAAAFFPSDRPALSLILTWAVFAIGFVLRPLGALIFGHLADKFGRRTVLMFSIVLMSLATLAMGIIPVYQFAGMLAPVLLILCRLVQGMAVSTEYSGAGTYLLEFKKNHKGLLSGMITSATGFGVFAASLLVLLFNSISLKLPFFANWRWPFIIAGISVGILGIYLRRNLIESPRFIEAKAANRLLPLPFLALLKNHKKTLLKAIIISGYTGIAIILIEIYLPAYLQTDLGMRKESALQLSTFLALTEACFAVMWGYCSDKIGRKGVMLIAGLLMLSGIFPLLALFNHAEPFLWFGAAAMLALTVGAIDGPVLAFLTESFPTEVRYTGVSVSYNVGVALIGGMSPGLLEFLKHQLDFTYIFPVYLAAGAVLLLVCLLCRL